MAIAGLGSGLWQLIGSDLERALKTHGPPPAGTSTSLPFELQEIERPEDQAVLGALVGAPVTWMPTGALGLVPIGLAQDPDGGWRLGENYQIAYAPSLSALKAAADQLKVASTAPLVEVINPNEDLPSTEIEGALVATYFKPQVIKRLRHNSATPATVLDALKGKSHWHFSTHGIFDWKDARSSGLPGRVHRLARDLHGARDGRCSEHTVGG